MGPKDGKLGVLLAKFGDSISPYTPGVTVLGCRSQGFLSSHPPISLKGAQYNVLYNTLLLIDFNNWW